MKTKIYLIAAALFVALIAGVWIQTARLKSVTNDRDVYRSNNDVLMKDVKTYQTKDSLKAATVGELQLKLSEFEKYRAGDLELIKTLQTKNRDLQAVTTAQSQTIIKLRGSVRDSIVYMPGDTITKTLKCVDIIGKWYEMHGCIDSKIFSGTFVCRDSLIIAETVKYKRFLGFLWKTSKIKDRKIDVVAKNPNTEILGVEFISIRK